MLNRTLNAMDLRRMIVAELPELSQRFEIPEVNGHRDMGVLFEFAVRAIEADDVDLTIRIFTLAGHLIEIASQLDVSSHSALWAGFCHGFGPYSKAGLNVFRKMDPLCRKTLYCPFQFPHTWFENEVMEPPCGEGTACTIRMQAQERSRFITQTCSVDHFADVTLRLSPNALDTRLFFVSEVPGGREAPLWVVEEIRDEVRRQIHAICAAGQRLCSMTIALVDTRYNPVDTRPSDVRKVAGEAFRRALEAAVLTEVA